MLRKTLTIFCLKCGYDLRASKDNCPECGLPFDPDDPHTYFPDARPRRSGQPFLVVALVGGGSVLLGIMSIGSDFDALGRVLLLGGLLIEVGILLVGSAILVLKRCVYSGELYVAMLVALIPPVGFGGLYLLVHLFQGA